MAIDTHIKFDGVDGESAHKDHKGEIQVITWNWRVSNPSAPFGGGSGQGKGDPGHFTFEHNYDKASPVLAKRCADGKHFATVTLTARKSGEGQKDFLVVTMKEAFITSTTPNGTQGGEIRETVTMTYGDIEFDYKPQDKEGAMGGSVKFGWDVKASDFR
jgi:type VI secretion system secreted protein Hcp